MNTPKEYRQMEYVPLMIELVKLLKPNTYVELGTKRGHTISQIAPLVKTAIGVDSVPMKSTAGFTFVNMTTLEYAATLEGRKPFIDMLFIDADHEWNALNADFNAFNPFVKPNGIILMHDTHPIMPELAVEGYCHNAWKVAQIISATTSMGYEIVTLPGPWAGLSIIRKLGQHHLAWAPIGYDVRPNGIININNVRPVISEIVVEEYPKLKSQAEEATIEPTGEDVPEEVLSNEGQAGMESDDSLSADSGNLKTEKTNRRGVRSGGFRKLLSPSGD